MIHGIPVGTITLEVTRRCHRRCAFCYMAGLVEAEAEVAVEEELPAAELAALVGGLVRRTGCDRVQLSGGEPLLRPDLLALVDGLRARGAKLSMVTDGGPLDAAMAGELAARGVGPIQPTLLAGAAPLHDTLRGRGAFHETTRAIAVAVAAGLTVTVSMVVTRRNWREAGAVADLAFALGARTLGLSRFCSAGGATGAHEALMPDAAQVHFAAVAAAARCEQHGLKLASVVTIPPCAWPDPAHPPLKVGVCSLMGPRTTVTVGPDGSVRSCSLSERVVGYLQTDDWEVLAERLWDQEIGPCRMQVPQACRACAYVGRCHGGCRLSAEKVFGDLDHADPLAP
jgi:radical SAM protein with 4Fe4S-binding SPASM domain